MSRKSFGTARATQQEEPIEFDIGEESFQVQRPLPGMLLLDIVIATEEENVALVLKAFNAFLLEALGAGDFERYRRACIDQRMSSEEVMSVATYVVEEGSGVPTQQRSDSEAKSLVNMTGSQGAATGS